MSYTVTWTPVAEQKLAAIWIAAEDRQAVTAAANEADQLLGRAPRACGESRGAMLRVMFAGPLGVEFEIVEDDQKVRVLTVWRVKHRS